MADRNKLHSKKSRPAFFAGVWVPRLAGLGFVVFCAAAAISTFSSGCSGWDPTKPFERRSPEVEKALELIDAGSFESAEEVLAHYLGTGICADGGIALPESARVRPDGSFDLGLVLFYIAEKYGRPFGEEETGEPGAEDPNAQKRGLEIDCALIIAKGIAADPKVPIELRARARYLAGNLEFLRKRYEEAVKEYDEALTLIPGIAEDAGGDGIGRDAAWNRAIALRRLQEQKDAGADADADADVDSPDSDDGDAPDSPDSEDAPDGNDGDADSGDSGDDAADGDSGPNPDGGEDGGPDGGDSGPPDAGNDAGDAGKDDKKDQPDPNEPDPNSPPQPATPQKGQDDRILEELEEAPSYQEEEAKKRAAGRRRGRMEDK